MYFCTLCFAFASVLDRTKNFLERRRVGYREETIRFGDFVGGRPTLFREFSVVNGGSKSEKGGGGGRKRKEFRVAKGFVARVPRVCLGANPWNNNSDLLNPSPLPLPLLFSKHRRKCTQGVCIRFVKDLCEGNFELKFRRLIFLRADIVGNSLTQDFYSARSENY